MQTELFPLVLAAYEAASDALPNKALYQDVVLRGGLAQDALKDKQPIGKSGQRHSVLARKLRWYQQDLKRAGILERVDGERGVWRLNPNLRSGLSAAPTTVKLVAFSTDLGVAIWGSCETVFDRLDVPITLCLTSPPYRLAKPRRYGNPATDQEYIDFILRALEPIVRNLVRGGSICLNLSNDQFETGSPERSMLNERLLLALHDRLGLRLMDRWVWENPCKPPGPVQWASKERVHLNAGYEPVYWLTNDPSKVFSDNRRVLRPHTERHLRLIRSGGEQRERAFSDGAYRIRQGRSFANQTDGRIPRNVLRHSHTDAERAAWSARVVAAGLPAHGASMPLSLADEIVRFLAPAGSVVVDPMAGSCTTALAADLNGCRWIAADIHGEYPLGAGLRFLGRPGFQWGCLDGGSLFSSVAQSAGEQAFA
jgi:site-specific DNA-methyltransferase (cytosine-N4-specific)